MDSPFLLLVTGGRDYQGRATVFGALDRAHAKHPNITILHDGASVVAEEWARDRARPYIADPRGSVAVLCYLPNAAVCFADGDADQAEAAGLKVWRVG